MGATVLDLACGSGVVARRSWARQESRCRVVGIDRDLEMLEVAQSAATGLGIDWLVADACVLPIANGSFDVVVCHHGLQLVSDRAGALGEMRRVLRTGGQVAVAVWSSIDHSPGYSALADAIARHVSADVAERYRSGPLGYHSLETLSQELSSAPFKVLRVVARERVVNFTSVADFMRCYAVGPAFSRATDGTLATMLEDLEAALEGYTTVGGLSFPMVAYFGVGIR